MADDGSQLTGEAKSFVPHRRLDLANEHDFQLGAFRVRPAYREVRRGEEIDILEPRVMQVLAALARRMGAVVSRDELLRDCWGDVSVTDDSLHRCIGRLRKLSESDQRGSFIIETVPRVGYRLVAADLADAPEEAPAPVAAPSPAAMAKPPRSRRALLLAAAVLVLSAAAGGGVWLANRPEAWRVAGFETAAGTPRYESHPALSAAGGQLAYAVGDEGGPHDIHVRNIRDGSTGLLVGGPTDDTAPAWSPTGDRLAFVRSIDGRPCEIMLKTLPDGPERRLAQCLSAETSRVTWAPDGRRLYFTDRAAAGAARRIYSVPAEGGEVRATTNPAAWMRGDVEPMISPDGKSLAFTRWSALGISDIYVQSLPDGPPRKITHDGAEVVGLAWSTSGKSLFFSSNRSGDFGFWSVPASGGEPTRLGSGLREMRRLSSGPGGVLAMEMADVRANLAEVGGAEDGKLITTEAGVQWAGDVSRNGVLAFVADTRAGRAVWTRAPGQPAQKMTFFPATHMDDVSWSPDGSRLAFIAASHGRYNLYEIAATGGPPRVLLSGEYEMTSPSWEANGQTLVLAAKRGGERRLWRLDTRKPGQITPITGPGWVTVRATPTGLLGMKEGVAGTWKVGPDGTTAQRLTEEPKVATNAWLIRGDRQFWLEWNRRAQSRIMSAPVAGGPARLVAPAPGATFYSGLAIDPSTGGLIYTRQISMDLDIGLMRLEQDS